MERKFKVGDKVKLVKGVDLEIIGIGVKLHGVFEIIDDSPGGDVWTSLSVDGQPTYSISPDGWRIPQSYLITSKSKAKSREPIANKR